MSLLGYVLLGLGSLAVLGAAGWLINKGLSLQRGYERETAIAANQAANRARVQMHDQCAPLPAQAKEKCADEIGDAYRDYRHETRDLEAQRTSALWTAFMGAAALLGMAVSIIGVGLVWITFNATRRGNEIAEDTAKRQLRAYVCLRPVFIDRLVPSAGPGPDRFVVTLPVENAGQTPANRLLIQWAWRVVPDGGKIAADFFEQTIAQHPVSGDREHCIGPGQLKEMPFRLAIEPPWCAMIQRGDAKFYLLGKIHYADAFGEDRTTEFFYTYNEQLPNRLGQMSVHNCIQ